MMSYTHLHTCCGSPSTRTNCVTKSDVIVVFYARVKDGVEFSLQKEWNGIADDVLECSKSYDR
jgi:hypothetical protein